MNSAGKVVNDASLDRRLFLSFDSIGCGFVDHKDLVNLRLNETLRHQDKSLRWNKESILIRVRQKLRLLSLVSAISKNK